MPNLPVIPVAIRTVFTDDGAFSKIRTETKSLGDSLRREFAQIGNVAREALSLPRQTGSFTLDIKGLEGAVADSRAFAGATRQVAEAARELSRTNPSSIYSEQARAAGRAAVEAERLARADEVLLNARRQLNTELAKTPAVTDRVVSGYNSAVRAGTELDKSTRQVRQATVQAGQQFQDIAISIAGGQRASTVFAQQLPQLAYAFQGLKGTVGAVATTLSGPWGLALIGATLLLGPFIDKLFKSGEQTDKFGKKIKSVSDLILDQNSALRENLTLLGKKQDAEVTDARKTLGSTISERSALQRQLEAAKARLAQLESDSLTGGRGDEARLGQQAATRAQISSLNAQIKLKNDLANAAGQNIRLGNISIIERKNSGKLDPLIAETIRYEKALQSLRDEYEKTGNGNFEAAQLNLLKIHQAKEKAIRAETKALKEQGGSSREKSRSPQEVLQEFTRELEQRGIRVISGHRTAQRQNELFKQGLTPADGFKIPSRHQNFRAVDVDPRTLNEAKAFEAAQAAGLKGFRILTESGGRKHLDFTGSGRRGEVDVAGPERQAEKAAVLLKAQADAAARLKEFGEDASKRLAGIRESFIEITPEQQRVNSAMAQLADLSSDVALRFADSPAKVKEYQAAIEDAGKAVSEGLNNPLRETRRINQEQADIDELLIQGKEAQAEALRRILAIERDKRALTSSEKDDILEIVKAEQRRAILIDKQRELQEKQLGIVNATADNARQSIREIVGGEGVGALGNALKRQFQIVQDKIADSIFESLFADTFQKEREKVLGVDRVSDAGQKIALTIETTVNPALEALATAANAAADKMNTAPGDEGPGITVVGKVIKDTGRKNLEGLSNIFEGLKATLGKALGGAAKGQAASGIASSIGIKQSKLGSQIGGAIGAFIPALGPLGPLIGGLIGGTIGGLFQKTAKGASVISNTGVSVTGNNAGQREAVTTASSSVQSGIASIANRLGGEIGNYLVSIGKYKDTYRVSASGSANVGNKRPGAVIYDGKDEGEAIRVAILNAIQDGAIKGIREGAQRLLQLGKDIEGQLDKALKFESVFTRLKAIKDPVGSALFTLNREFAELRNIFTEASASAADFAELEELYGLQRTAAIKQATEQVTGSLRSLIDNLTTGDSGLSLRDRVANVRDKFDPLAADIRSGRSVDYNAFSDLGQQLIDLARQIDGSTSGYFSVFDEVLGLSRTALAKEENVISLATGTGTISGTPSLDNTAVVNAIGGQTTELASYLASINSNIAAGNLRAANSNSSSGSGSDSFFSNLSLSF